jgi:acetoacetyl-CoA synthetase
MSLNGLVLLRTSADVLRIARVDDCIVVAQKTPDGDERVVLFIKPHVGQKLTGPSVEKIKETISTKLSRRHVPAKVIECPGELCSLQIAMLPASSCLRLSSIQIYL